MADVAKYIRIFNSNPDDDYVSKRVSAINAIETSIKKKTSVTDILSFADNLLQALDVPLASSQAINNVAVAALKKSSTSFVSDEEQLQLLSCTLLATLQFLEKAKGYNNVPSPVFILAIALWSGLSFQKPILDKEKLEALRSEILLVASDIVENISIISRDRKETSLLKPLVVPATTTIATFATTVEETYGTMLNAMRVNAYLDREEIDILWWVLGGWSETCKIQISSLNTVQKALVSSYEIGGLLKRFPAKAHTHLSCRGTQHSDQYSAVEIVDEMGDISPLIVNNMTSKDTIKNCSKIFVISNLLQGGQDDNSLAEQKRPISEWAARMLLELSLLNIHTFTD